MNSKLYKVKKNILLKKIKILLFYTGRLEKNEESEGYFLHLTTENYLVVSLTTIKFCHKKIPVNYNIYSKNIYYFAQ